jgi:hypothetical protein
MHMGLKNIAQVDILGSWDSIADLHTDNVIRLSFILGFLVCFQAEVGA